jgi:hypothetical protein
MSQTVIHCLQEKLANISIQVQKSDINSTKKYLRLYPLYLLDFLNGLVQFPFLSILGTSK